MEKFEMDKIRALSPDLIKCIDCNVTLTAHLRAANIISLEDEHQLETLPNKMIKSYELLNILCARHDGYKFLVEGLRESCQTGALKLLGESVHDESIHKSHLNDSGMRPFKKIPFHSDEATQLFTGRGSELDILLSSLLPDGGTASINGIGGIGKTELAKMFLQKLDEKEYENVFKQIVWINCESTFTATTDFTTIAKDYLEVPTYNSSSQHRDISSILYDVYEKLAKSKSLVILDNAETNEILKTYMPKTSRKRKISILVTSQSIKTGIHISLESLSLSDAVKFVKKGLSIHSPISEEFEISILKLVKRLEMLPLAIIQAVGYIKEKREMYLNYGPHEYLVDLDRIPKLIFETNSYTDLSSNGRTIYQTLDLSLSRIEACSSFGMLALKILTKVAYMAPDNIPSSVFTELPETNIDAIEHALSLIRRFSIIKCSPVKRISTIYFNIHRLVQDVLRIRIDQKHETESSIHSIMDLLSSHFNYVLTDHALESWKHASKIPHLVELFSSFPIRITKHLWKTGRITEAYDFSALSLILLKQNLALKEHASTIFLLQSCNSWLLFLQGKPDDSLKKLQETLYEAKKFLSNSDEIILKLKFYITQIDLKRMRNY